MARRVVRSGRRSSSRSGPRRKWVWAREDVTEQTIAASGVLHTDALAQFETAYGADLLGATIMRVRGQMVHDQSIVAGMRVFTQDTLAGLTASNGPDADQHADWFVYQASFVEAAGTRRVVELDIRAARKLEELGQSLLWSVQNLSGSIVTVSWRLSLGLKLP